MIDRYIFKNGKQLRCGFTTGACAAAAAKASAYMLLTGKKVHKIDISLRYADKGKTLSMYGEPEDIYNVDFELEEVSLHPARCGVRKDGGDDIDVTDGMLICAEVHFEENEPHLNADTAVVEIVGGEGVGVVTKKGLNQPPGEAAINSGPRRMINDAVLEVCREQGFTGRLVVTISVPGGVEMAEKTFNPMLGIEGGISILGTTGIVEPMSEPAIIETIRTEIKVKAEDSKYLVTVPGNYGMVFASEKMGVPQSRIVKCSNYVGETIDAACEAGVKGLLLAGNIGKFIKLAGGIFNTHSRNADARLDILVRCALQAGASYGLLRELDECVTTDAAIKVLAVTGKIDAVMELVLKRAEENVKRRCSESEIETGLVFFSNENEVLCATDNMLTLLNKIV